MFGYLHMIWVCGGVVSLFNQIWNTFSMFFNVTMNFDFFSVLPFIILNLLVMLKYPSISKRGHYKTLY